MELQEKARITIHAILTHCLGTMYNISRKSILLLLRYSILDQSDGPTAKYIYIIISWHYIIYRISK